MTAAGAEKDNTVSCMSRHIEEQNKRLEALNAEVGAQCDENSGLRIPALLTSPRSSTTDSSTWMR